MDAQSHSDEHVDPQAGTTCLDLQESLRFGRWWESLPINAMATAELPAKTEVRAA